jgi:hypothetical protein
MIMKAGVLRRHPFIANAKGVEAIAARHRRRGKRF